MIHSVGPCWEHPIGRPPPRLTHRKADKNSWTHSSVHVLTFSRTKNSKTLLNDGGKRRAYVTAILKNKAWKRRSRTLMSGFWFMLGFRILLGPMLLLTGMLSFAWFSDMISRLTASDCTRSQLILGQHVCSNRSETGPWIG